MTNEPLTPTLYNRLKESEHVKLDSIATIYPSTYQLIRDELKRLDNVFSLDLCTLDTIRLHLKWDLNDVINYFDDEK